MALSMRVAIVTCLGFISGMAWLVSQVARPTIELPTPLIVRGPEADAERTAVFASHAEPRHADGKRAENAASRFARPSPIELAVQARPQATGGQALAASSVFDELDAPPLPPLYVPAAPVVVEAEDTPVELASADGEPAEAPSPFDSTIPEAVVAGEAEAHARLLAAVTSGDADEEATDVQNLEASSRQPPGVVASATREYRVRRGDTLMKIIRREWNSDDEALLDVLLAANPDLAGRSNRIFPGEAVRIPELRSPAERSQVAVVVSCEPDDRRGAGERSQWRWYTIRKRDSLAAIARRILHDEGRWREIAELNNMRNAHKILPGTRIKLPAATLDT